MQRPAISSLFQAISNPPDGYWNDTAGLIFAQIVHDIQLPVSIFRLLISDRLAT